MNVPVVPVQFSPDGTAGFTVHVVEMMPLFVGVNVPVRENVPILNVPAEVVVSAPFAVMTPLAELVPLVLPVVRPQL